MESPSCCKVFYHIIFAVLVQLLAEIQGSPVCLAYSGPTFEENEIHQNKFQPRGDITSPAPIIRMNVPSIDKLIADRSPRRRPVLLRN